MDVFLKEGKPFSYPCFLTFCYNELSIHHNDCGINLI